MRNRLLSRVDEQSHGFTLIEVLVVVAIIALLVAIMLPSLAAAREQAKQVQCGTNTRQMGLALNMYAMQYKHFPGHHLTNGNPQLGLVDHQVLWPARLLAMMKGQNQVFWCPSAPDNTRWNGHDIILPNIADADQPNETALFAYGYNDWGVREFTIPHLGLGGHINDPNWGELRLDKVKRPAEMIAVGDNDSGAPNGVTGEWDTALDPINDSHKEWPGNRHRKGANVVFCDGHTEWRLQKQLVETQVRTRQQWNNDFRAHCLDWGDNGWSPSMCPPGSE